MNLVLFRNKNPQLPHVAGKSKDSEDFQPEKNAAFSEELYI